MSSARDIIDIENTQYNSGIAEEYCFDSIESIIADYKQGKMVVVVDDEDRENEGDLFVAAQCITPEKINFMTKFARGVICLVLTEDRCAQIDLPLMARDRSRNRSPFYARFTMSVEAAKGVTTGVSVTDRATTIKACISDDAKPEDIIQPGHVFPLMAQPGGVLARAGHTEASSDLARLSGFTPYSVLVEILNEDGSMARRDDLVKFAKQHNLKIGTVADLIEYRLKHECVVVKKSEQVWPTKYGEFNLVTFEDTISKLEYYVLVKGNLCDPNEVPYIKLHTENKATDLLFYCEEKSTHWPMSESIEYIANKNNGAVVILSNNHTAEAKDKNKANNKQKTKIKAGIYSQLLKALGVTKINLLASALDDNYLLDYGIVIDHLIENQII